MNYLDYSIEDFVMDEKFQQWVQHPTPEQNAFWSAFLEQYPHKSSEIGEARKLALFFHFKKFTPTPQEYEEVLQKIYSKPLPRIKVAGHANKRGFHLRNWVKYAAVITIVLISSLFLFEYFPGFQAENTIQVATAFGEKKRVLLPDSSVVFLNANSRLTYHSDWQNTENNDETEPSSPSTREVWLEGEAFFDVRQIPTSQQAALPSTFVVHTSRLDVEVLGTTFNVNNRRDKTQVVLNTGKIKLKSAEQGQDELLMVPGEMVEFTGQDRQLTQKTVNPVIYSSWVNNQLIFDNKPLFEVIQLLEDNYGMNVTLENQQFLDRKLTGKYPADKPDVLLQAISDIFQLKVTKNDKSVVIQ